MHERLIDSFIPMDESQGLSAAETGKACGKTDHTRKQEWRLRADASRSS
jgi:hypothetical protein